MAYYIFKVLLTTGFIVAISEISKRTTFIGDLLASLPIVSYLGMIWLYVETGNQEVVAASSKSVFWLVLPSSDGTCRKNGCGEPCWQRA